MAAEGVLRPDAIVRALRGAFSRGARREELLRIAAARIQAVGPPFTGVYLYMLRGDQLVLEAHAGRETEHTRIPVGRGLCGQAVGEGRDIYQPDVRAAPSYLACSLETKAELIVLIRRHEEILGQIDIDSDVLAGFTDAQHRAVKEVADALAVLL